jgi:hypothetical protein
MNATNPIIRYALCAVLFLCFSQTARADEPWQEVKSSHFVVYFLKDQNFAKNVSNNAERYYKTIADDLGYSRRSNFWQWDNRVKIYIYEDRGSFIKLGNYPGWSEGIADYRLKAIFTYSGSGNFTASILPHEIAHLIFRDFVGLENRAIPMWLDEGVAQWEEPEKRSQIKRAIKSVYAGNDAMPLDQFTAFDITRVKDETLVRNYYIQAMSLVDFMVGEYGSDRFVIFCRNLRDGKTLEDALRFSYPTSMRNIDDLEDKWVEWIRRLQ